MELKLPLTSDVNERSVPLPGMIAADGLTSVKLRLMARSKAAMRSGAIDVRGEADALGRRWIGERIASVHRQRIRRPHRRTFRSGNWWRHS